MGKVEGFLIDEIVTKGGMPYFPVGKVAKLLGVTRQDVYKIFESHSEIFELSITVTDNKSDETETYIDPVGCALMAMNCETSQVGEDLKVSMKTVLDLVGPGSLDKAKKYIDSDKAHPFVKALFEWSFEIGKDNDFWSKLPEQ